MSGTDQNPIRLLGQVLRTGSKGRLLSRSGRIYSFDGRSIRTIAQGDWVSFSIFLDGSAEPIAEDLCFTPSPSAESGQSHYLIAGKLGEGSGDWFNRILNDLEDD